ncbi:replication-relaxation family protein [Streptomyces pseudovenezuelae]|uniref:replication-relaxation family protein n=1 Tax=Streptomyces pseudovenezuelae TaxID=67350 RepID=UPI0036ECB954
MAQVITKEDADGRSYVRRAMKELAELGLAETNGKDGKHPIWNLTPEGQKALADGNELPPRPKAGTGAKAVKAGFGPHGVAVTDMILAFGGRKHLTDWQVEVNHAIKETGLSFNTDAVLAWPTKTSEVRLFELDNGTMSQARLAKEVWDYERYAGHCVWEGARGTIGNTFPFWQCHRYTRSQTFPRLHVVLAGKEEHLLDNCLKALADDVKGIAVAVWVNTLPQSSGASPGTRSASTTRIGAVSDTPSPPAVDAARDAGHALAAEGAVRRPARRAPHQREGVAQLRLHAGEPGHDTGWRTLGGLGCSVQAAAHGHPDLPPAGRGTRRRR